MPPLAGLDGLLHTAARRPGRLGSARPSTRSLEATSRIGTGAAGLALALALPPREAEREKARPALPEKALCLGGRRRQGRAAVERGYLEHPGPWLGAHWVGLSSWECRAAQSRQARSEEGQRPNWGTAERGVWPCCGAKLGL
jgi:hypothetical protein